MSRLSYVNSVTDHRVSQPDSSLTGFIKQLPYITVSEMEEFAESNRHLSEQIPRYLSDMVSHECRLIGF